MLGAGWRPRRPRSGWFYLASLVTGAGVACTLSAGFAGVATYFSGDRVEWAMGWVVGSQAAAWIVGTPVIGFLAEEGSWRLSFVVPAAIGALALVAGLMAPRGRALDRHRRARGAHGRLPRALGAALDARRAGGVLGLDRRDHLRRRLLHRELRPRRGHRRAAAADRLGGVPRHLHEHEPPHRPLSAPAADRAGRAGDGRDARAAAQLDPGGGRSRSRWCA